MIENFQLPFGDESIRRLSDCLATWRTAVADCTQMRFSRVCETFSFVAEPQTHRFYMHLTYPEAIFENMTRLDLTTRVLVGVLLAVVVPGVVSRWRWRPGTQYAGRRRGSGLRRKVPAA